MTTLSKRATPRQALVLRMVEGACRNIMHAHPGQPMTDRMCRRIAKRAAGTISAGWAELLAASAVRKAVPDTWRSGIADCRRDRRGAGEGGVAQRESHTPTPGGKAAAVNFRLEQAAADRATLTSSQLAKARDALGMDNPREIGRRNRYLAPEHDTDWPDMVAAGFASVTGAVGHGVWYALTRRGIDAVLLSGEALEAASAASATAAPAEAFEASGGPEKQVSRHVGLRKA